MDINRNDLFFKRLTQAVHNLGTLSHYQHSDENDTILALAKMRRFTLCFIAFIHYASERAGLSKKEFELLEYEEIIEILFQREVFSDNENATVDEMMAMYEDLTSYDPQISINEQELIRHIDHAYTFLTEYVARQSIHDITAAIQDNAA